MRPAIAKAVTWSALLSAGCVGGGPATLDGFVAQAQREYHALAPSLEGAAARLVADMRPLGVEYRGKPDLTWGWMHAVSTAPPTGEITIFDVQATETVITYAYRDIAEIVRTPSLTHPYRAVVRFAVTVRRRRSKKLTVDVPGTLQPVMHGTARAPRSLPLPPVPAGVPAEYPEPVRELAATAIDECLSADPTAQVSAVPVTLRYSAAASAWQPLERSGPARATDAATE
ncbi:MAG: hypothetical protein ACYTKD_12525 [Planctomycetota bacterium]|jgi:hypothetical protein